MVEKRWDVFVSYASEDRDTVAQPLVEALEKCGLAVWYDQTQLQVGDSIRRKIDEGLTQARYGVVILSPSFFAKHYPVQELDGLAQQEQDGAKVILPVWHDVAEMDVRQHSAWLAGRFAAEWDDGIPVVVEQLLNAIISEDDQQAAQWSTEASVHRIQSAGQLIDVFSGTHGFSFHTDDPNGDEVESVAGFQQELQDWSDIWTQMTPADQTRASVRLGEHLTQLQSIGWSVYGRLEQRRLRGMSEEGPIAVVAIIRGEPKAVLSLSEGLAVVRGERRKFSTDYLDYDAKKLCEAYPDEQAIAPLVSYKEEICWIGSTLEQTLAEAGAVQVKRMEMPFVLDADTDVMRIFQVEALNHRKAQGHMGRGDDSVIRLQSYSNNSGAAVLEIQRARYSDQVQSNLVMDWTADHALKKSGFKTLRTYLSARYPRILGPLTESIMANTIGISVVLYYRTPAGAYRPYLPGRAKGQAVFDGGFHCTASGAAAWSEAGRTFEEIFVEDMYAELREEVGIAENEIEVMVPLALCREFLRGGKPQIFFAGVTSLSEDELQTRRRRAIQSQKKKGRLEIVDKQLIGSDTEDFRKKLLSEPLTLEATANLYYAEKFMKQY